MKTVFLFLFFWFFLVGLPAQAPRLVVPVGHTNGVTSIAFSPDGKYVLTGSWDHTAKLWNLAGREIQVFEGHFDEVTSVAFSPDGKYVLTGSRDNTAKLWNLAGKEIQIFEGHFGEVASVAFSLDGKFILTASKDNTAKLWDLVGNEILSIKGHSGYVTSVAFSPDGKSILTGSSDSTAKIWNLAGKEIQVFKGHSDAITSAKFSPDGKYVLTGGEDNNANLWNLVGKKVQIFRGHRQGVTSIAFSPNGKFILTGSQDNTAKLWNLAGKEILSFEHPIWGFIGVSSVIFSPNGEFILTGGYDTSAILWNLRGEATQSFAGRSSKVLAVEFSPDGKSILTGRYGCIAEVWDIVGKEMHSIHQGRGYLESVAFSPDGKFILVKSTGTAKLWDSAGKEIQSFEDYKPDVFSNQAGFSPDGKFVILKNSDSTAQLWNLAGEEILSFKFNGSENIAFSPDGKSILTGGWGNTARIWDLEGKEVQVFKGHSGYVTSVDFSPDGKFVLTGSQDGTARLWDIKGKEIQVFKGHFGYVTSAVFSPDGKSVLTGSWDNTARLWDMKGKEIQVFKGHSGYVTSVAFSPDRKFVLTGSWDNTARIWDALSGREYASLIGLYSTDWIVTTPSGLFDASPGAMKLMYHVQGLEVIELDQLKERYYEPGLLAKIMGFDKTELRNVAAFDQVALYPEIKAAITNHQLAIQLTERNGGLGKLSLFLNGKEVQEDLNPQRLKNLDIDLNTFAKYYPADTTITLALRAYNAEGWLKSQAYELTYKPAANPVGKTIPQLYAVVVGTSNYAGDRLDLRFADLDAEAMAKAFQNTGSALFGTGHTSVQLLSTSAAAEMSSKNNIRRAFVRIAEKSTPADVLVVYFSGHGISYGDAEKAQFYYLTKDIGSEDLSDPEVRSKYAISSDTLTKWLTDIPAKKQVMILDACNAGKVLETLAALDKKELNPSQIRAFDRMKDRTGMFILTGSAADQVSYEASQYGQGLLTYSLLQGMSGLALKENKYVDVNTLFQYSCDQVPQLAQGIGGVQKPILASPGGASFDIGIVQPGAISVAQKKPVFIRNVFQEETSFDDVLGLTDALETLFQRITAKGARAEVIFVDVKEYGAAYSMKGRYTMTGDAVEVRVRLFQGKTSVGEEFKVLGNKDAVGELADAVFRKVGELLGIRH
jgi:WD40 repeat protein